MMKHLQSIADTDVVTLRVKDKSYGGSWKRRGGVGAFMMLRNMLQPRVPGHSWHKVCMVQLTIVHCHGIKIIIDGCSLGLSIKIICV